jgi:type II secretory pathway pseudopilin PulG
MLFRLLGLLVALAMVGVLAAGAYIVLNSPGAE